MDTDLYTSFAAYGTELGKKIARRVSKQLIAMTDSLMSGEGTGLRNVWDEVCVQVQDEESLYWDAYIDVMERHIHAEVESLKRYERDALWLSTEQGEEWSDEDGVEPKPYPGHSLEQITEHILNEHLLGMAMEWKNARITRYLEGDGDQMVFF